MVPITEDQALSIGMLRYQRHLHFGLYAQPAAPPGARRRPDVLAEEVNRRAALTRRRSQVPAMAACAGSTCRVSSAPQLGQ
jgi:hypothetical protein